MPRIVGTGLVALDLIVEHGTSGRRTSTSGGGTCGNVLAILASLGWQAQWLGALGPSEVARAVGDDLAAAGVGVSGHDAAATVAVFAHHVRQTPGTAAEHWFATECPSCQRAMPRYVRPADSWLSRLASEVDQCDVFFADRLTQATVDLAARAREAGALVVYEPSAASDAPWMSAMFQLANVVKYSRERAHALAAFRTDRKDLLWIETCGSQGMRWSRRGSEGEMHALPAVTNLSIRDSGGAGDWFTGAFLYQLARLTRAPATLPIETLRQILGTASRVAAWSCGYLGARGMLYDGGLDQVGASLGASGTASRTAPPRPLAPSCVEHRSGPTN